VNDKLKLAFAEVLADARAKARLSKQALADHSNMSVTFVKKLEDGRAIPSLETILKLCGALNLSLAAIGRRIDPRLKSYEKQKVRLTSGPR
jgi:transcriptional regulator with XRE-family HTH domain